MPSPDPVRTLIEEAREFVALGRSAFNGTKVGSPADQLCTGIARLAAALEAEHKGAAEEIEELAVELAEERARGVRLSEGIKALIDETQEGVDEAKDIMERPSTDERGESLLEGIVSAFETLIDRLRSLLASCDKDTTDANS
jgi:hypothetical protein